MNDGIYKKFSNWYVFYKDVPSGVQNLENTKQEFCTLTFLYP